VDKTIPANNRNHQPIPPIPLLLCMGGGLDRCGACGGELGPDSVAIETVEKAEDGSLDRGLLFVYHPLCSEGIVHTDRIRGNDAVTWPTDSIKALVLHPERAGRENNVCEILNSFEEKATFLRAVGITEVEPTNGAESSGPSKTVQMTSAKKNSDPKDKDSPAQQLLKFVTASAELFHTADQEAFVSFRVGDHRETHRIADARDRLAGLYFTRTAQAASQETISQVIMVLKALAKFGGPEHPVFVRIAGHEDAIYLDLGDESWEAVKITAEGWQIVADVPVKFRRPPGMEALPRPQQNGDLARLRQLLNIQSDDDWILIQAWLVAAFRPSGPYAILALEGPQGSAKSTATRALRKLVDPNTSPSRAEPRNPRDLMIAARNGWCMTFDNLSNMPDWLSDCFCRLSTTGGFSTRMNYSDDAEVLFNATRPILVNGIDVNFQRGDLLDRAIMIALGPISSANRLTEVELWRRFVDMRASILGSLLTAVSCALRRLRQVNLSELPRMADFLTWATAAEPALGLDEGAVLAAYNRNKRTSSELALESSPVVPALEKLLREGSWEGTSTELLNKLCELTAQGIRNGRDWPKNPRDLSACLRRLAPDLRNSGIEVQFVQTAGSGSRKRIIIRKLGVQ
jgi:hypothetical protein